MVTANPSAAAAYDANAPDNPDYTRPNATTATKTDTPVMETPMSIQVLPQAVIRDQLESAIKRASTSANGARATFAGRPCPNPDTQDIGRANFIHQQAPENRN